MNKIALKSEKRITSENSEIEQMLAGKEEGGEAHETTLYAESIFHVGSFSVTNSLLSTWLVVVFLIILAFALEKRLSKVPSGIQNFFEMIMEKGLELSDAVTGDREKSIRLFPLVFILFLFILINNWSGLLPGVGTIGFYEGAASERTFVPFFRGGTADINTTMGLAIMSIVITHVLGVITVGGWRYLNKFVNIKSFLEIPEKIWKEPTILLVNPIKAFIGIIEIIGEAAKVASLSFRLFGNVFAGEVLLVSISALFAYFVPIPFMFLELLVGLVQAVVFCMLILVFTTIATTKEEH
jgi:F-type H+-transporting ATPase subunit a